MSTYPVSSFQDQALGDLQSAAIASDPEQGKVYAVAALTNALLAVGSALEQIAEKMPDS